MDQFFTAIFGVKDHLDWVQECARAVLIFFYGLLVLRLSGRRTFAKWSALDLIFSIIVGSSLSRAMTGSAPLPGTLAAVAALVALHVIFSFFVSRSRAVSLVVEGEPVAIAQNGKVDHKLRLRHLISMPDLFEALRQKGVERPEDAKAITLEPNGTLTVIKAEKG